MVYRTEVGGAGGPVMWLSNVLTVCFEGRRPFPEDRELPARYLLRWKVVFFIIRHIFVQSLCAIFCNVG